MPKLVMALAGRSVARLSDRNWALEAASLADTPAGNVMVTTATTESAWRSLRR
jgi:hypothetical protein